MHTLQILLVEAENSLDAAVTAEEMENDWSDWREIGGRWSSFMREFLDENGFPSIPLSNSSVLPIAGNEAAAIMILRDSAKRANQEFLAARSALTGAPVAIADIDGHMFGMPVAQNAETAHRMSARNTQIAEEWETILAKPDLLSVREEISGYFSPALYQARTLISILLGEWSSDSGFYDSYRGTADPGIFLEHLRNENNTNYSYPSHEKLFFVAVDFHF